MAPCNGALIQSKCVRSFFFSHLKDKLLFFLLESGWDQIRRTEFLSQVIKALPPDQADGNASVWLWRYNWVLMCIFRSQRDHQRTSARWVYEATIACFEEVPWLKAGLRTCLWCGPAKKEEAGRHTAHTLFPTDCPLCPAESHMQSHAALRDLLTLCYLSTAQLIDWACPSTLPLPRMSSSPVLTLSDIGRNDRPILCSNQRCQGTSAAVMYALWSLCVLQSTTGGSVPYLGTYLTVLTMLDTALSDTVEVS